MNAPTAAALTASIKSAHAARMARLAPMGNMPAIGDTVVEGRFSRQAKVVSVNAKALTVEDEDGQFIIMPESFTSDIRPWRVLQG